MFKKIILILCFLFLTACGVPITGEEDNDGLEQNDHRVFVSSKVYSGNMGGVLSADAQCAALASAAGLKKKYKAILSTDTESAKFRLTITGSVYLFTTASDKKLIAASSADLWGTDSKNLLNNINISESYALVSSNVWSGTNSDGSSSTDNCSNWSSNSGIGWYGITSGVNDTWVESNTSSCAQTYPIYCISQNI